MGSDPRVGSGAVVVYQLPGQDAPHKCATRLARLRGMDMMGVQTAAPAGTALGVAPVVPGSFLLGSARDLRRDMLGVCERAFQRYGDVVRLRFGPPGARMEMHLLSHPGAAHRWPFHCGPTPDADLDFDHLPSPRRPQPSSVASSPCQASQPPSSSRPRRRPPETRVTQQPQEQDGMARTAQPYRARARLATANSVPP
jgi:hypothetical protein